MNTTLFRLQFGSNVYCGGLDRVQEEGRMVEGGSQGNIEGGVQPSNKRTPCQVSLQRLTLGQQHQVCAGEEEAAGSGEGCGPGSGIGSQCEGLRSHLNQAKGRQLSMLWRS
jgi:hypothetical protein